MDIKVQRYTELGAFLKAAHECEGSIFYLAGGTDLMVQLKAEILPDGTWFDISDIPELHGIRDCGDHLEIGSGVSHHEAMRSELLKKYAPALVLASSNVGGPQVRSRGTLGGNLGNASPAADTVPALYSLGAVLNLISAEGKRSVPVEEFTLRPRRTVLKHGEIIYSISIPKREGNGGYWNSIAQRHALAISKINIGFSYVADRQADGSVKFGYLQIAFGSVGPTVLRARKTEEFLLAEPVTKERALQAAEIAKSEVTPISDIRSTADYRKEMAGVMLLDAINTLIPVVE